MGLALPSAPMGPEVAFDLDGTPIRLTEALHGRGVRLVAQIGVLPPNPHAANDALRRVLRLALPLAAFNRATVALPIGRDRAALEGLLRGLADPAPVIEATVVIPDPATAPLAVQDLMQWRHYVADILLRVDGAVGEALAPATAPVDPPDMMIFQP
jgi:hypothetical protein